MRQIRLGDLHHAACAALSVPPPQRVAFCDSLLWRAHVADKYVKRLGKLHPDWGDGSVRGAVLRLCGERSLPRGSVELCAGVQVVLMAMQRRSWVKNR